MSKQNNIFSEKTFAIDLIVGSYDMPDPIDPIEICRLAKSDLDTYITPSEVIDYMCYVEDFEKINWTINSKEIFNE